MTALDPRLPLKIKPLPGGYAIAFADGGQHVVIYGREKHVANAAGALTKGRACRENSITRRGVGAGGAVGVI